MAVTLESIKKSVGKKNDSPVFVWLADLERKEGFLDAALMRIDSGLEKFPKDLSALIVRSAILFEQEKWGETLEICEKILRRDPYVLSVLYRAGLACEKLDRPYQRNLYFSRLHDLDPLDSFWSDEYADISGLENNTLELGLGENDPFAAIATLLPEEYEDENISFDQLKNDLGETFSELERSDLKADDFIDEDISGGDISSAFSDFFGSDELKDDFSEPVAPMSVFSSFAQETSASEKEKISESLTPPPIPDLPEEEPSSSTSEAFDQLFGNDDLPEETSSLSEKPSESEEPSASASDAFDLLLGEDELPEEFSKEKTKTSSLSEALEDSEFPISENAMEETLAEKEMEIGEIELTSEVASSFDALFGDDQDDWGKNTDIETAPLQVSETQESEQAPSINVSNEDLKSNISSSFDELFGKDESLDAVEPLKTAGAFETLFEKTSENTKEEFKTERSDVDFLMSGDSDDEIENALIKNPNAKLDANGIQLDESLNTPTLAEIYYEQGLYKEALEIYQDLVQKDPDNQEIQNRLSEVEMKFKENNNDN